MFLAAAGLGLIVAYAAGWPALLAVALFLFGAVAAAAATVVASPPALVVERRIDPPIVEQLAPVRVGVEIRGTAPGPLEWTEDLPRSVVVTGRAAGVLETVRPDRAAEVLEYAFTARARGSVPI